jgi:hypothetical protein
MSTYFEWAEAKTTGRATGEVSGFDLVEWPDIAVSETELSLEETAKLRALIDERELEAQLAPDDRQ